MKKAQLVIGTALIALSLVVTGTTWAQPVIHSVLHPFTNAPTDGQGPNANLALGVDNALYGTTAGGGAILAGTVFKINRDGSDYRLLHVFTNSPDGSTPQAAVMEGADGALYGTTSAGGSNNLGTVFRISRNGSGYSVLYSFGGTPDGARPSGQLLQASDGLIYGTTHSGGANGAGTVFKLNPAGTGYIQLLSFTNSTDGSTPLAGLLQAANGTLYGTTSAGGASGLGTVFKLQTNGSGYTVLHTFTNSPDGANCLARLVQGNDGLLYGTTVLGGTNGQGTVFSLKADGTAYAVLHHFGAAPGASQPFAGLVHAWDNALYGTTSYGGTANVGSIFKIYEGGGGYQLMHSLIGLAGTHPIANLTQGPSSPGDSGVLYGTANSGGVLNNGTVFAFVVNPPLSIVPTGNQNQTTLFWPAWALNYVLQTCTNVASGDWVTVTNGIPLAGVQLTNVTDSTKAFYRLVWQP